MFERYTQFIVKHPRGVFFALLAIALIAIYPAIQIQTDFNLEGFYPEGDQVIADYELLETEFGRDDNTILIGFSHPNLFDEHVLSDIREISDSLSNIQFVEDVYSLWNASELNESGGMINFDPYLTDENIETLSPDSLRAQMTSDPFLSGFLISRDGSATALAIQINEDENTYSNRNTIIDSIEDVLAYHQEKYTFHISGIPYYRNQYVNMLNTEIIGYISISSLLIIFLLWYLYRTIWGILFPMIIVWATLLFTIAIMQLTGGYLEIMSSTIAPILLCVGVADSIHMISKYDDARESGMGKMPSIVEMMKTLGSATLLTSITTAIGFASLLSSSVVPMKKFGIYTAVGVLVAYLITIIFLPAALRLSRKKRVVNEKSSSFYPLISRWLQRLTALNRMNYGKVLVLALLITLGFSIGMKDLTVNGKVYDDISEDTKIMQDSRFFTEQIAPQFPMEIIVDFGEPEGALTASAVKNAVELEKRLLSFPEIERVTGLHTLISEVHKLFSDESIEASPLPDSDQAVAQYTLLLEVSGSEELYRLVDFNYSKLRITAFTEDAGSKRINEIKNSLQQDINELFEDENVVITGTTILSADLTDKIVYSLAWSIVIALFAITGIMVVLFKDVRLILIALIPNLIPLITVAGVMGFFNIDIKPSTAVIFTIALGIAVDDSIHYLARLRIETRRRKALFPALSATTVRTGRAIIITSMILIAGFGTLITSSFTSTAMMGILVCTTIFSAVIADLFVLPSLFYWLNPKLRQRDVNTDSKAALIS
jgi:predicted RND superfamily exporter protein